MFRIPTFVFTAVVLVLPAAASVHAAPLVLQWGEQLGTADLDESFGVSADSLGNVYITGYTAGSLGGPNAGSTDAFVAKYDIPRHRRPAAWRERDYEVGSAQTVSATLPSEV